MKHAQKFLFVLASLVALALISVVFAKDRLKPREGHTYFSASGQYPPSPFHPFPGLSTRALNHRAFVYDDSKLDYAAIRAAVKESIAEAKLQSGAALLSESGGGGSMSLLSQSGLRLAPPALDGSNTTVAVLGAEEGAQYDLFHSTNLLAWQWLGRGVPGQTNFTFSNLPQPVGFLILGTMQDSDADTLTDAFENLVSQTDALAFNGPGSVSANNPAFPLLVDVPVQIRLREYHRKEDIFQEFDPCQVGSFLRNSTNQIDWVYGQGGMQTYTEKVGRCPDGQPTNYTLAYQVGWPINSAAIYRFTSNGQWSAWSFDGPEGPVPGPPTNAWEKVHLYFDNSYPPQVLISEDTARAEVDLVTGGRALSRNRNLIRIHGTAVERFYLEGDPIPYSVPVPPTEIQVLGHSLDTNGNLFVVLPDSTTNNATPSLPPQYTNYVFDLTAVKGPEDGALVISTIAPNAGWPGPRPAGMLPRLGYPFGATPSDEQIIFDVLMNTPIATTLTTLLTSNIFHITGLPSPGSITINTTSGSLVGAAVADREWITLALLARSTNPDPKDSFTFSEIDGFEANERFEYRLLNEFLIQSFSVNGRLAADVLQPFRRRKSAIGGTLMQFGGSVNVSVVVTLLGAATTFTVTLPVGMVNAAFAVGSIAQNAPGAGNDQVFAGMIGDSWIRHHTSGKAGALLRTVEQAIIQKDPPDFESSIKYIVGSEGGMLMDALTSLNSACTWPSAFVYAYDFDEGVYRLIDVRGQVNSPFDCFINLP